MKASHSSMTPHQQFKDAKGRRGKERAIPCPSAVGTGPRACPKKDKKRTIQFAAGYVFEVKNEAR